MFRSKIKENKNTKDQEINTGQQGNEIEVLTQNKILI